MISTLGLRRSEAKHPRLIGVPFSAGSASMLDNLQKTAVRADPGVNSFFQSREWQEIQERIGRATFRVNGVLIIRHDLPWGLNYLYTPRPEGADGDFFSQAGRLALESGAVFLKIDPVRPLPTLAPLNFSSFSIQARETTTVDCRKGESGLLSAMRAKTRYNIRLAERHGVRARLVPPEAIESEFEPFWQLLSQTAERDRFSLHDKSYYRILLETRNADFENQLWLAERDGELLAAAIVNFYHPSATATYLHGASSGERRQIMAPYLLHWAAIKAVKNRGFSFYDFGGIDERRWPGLSRFKKGFGGATLNFPESRDFVFRPVLYRLYRLQHALRHG